MLIRHLQKHVLDIGSKRGMQIHSVPLKGPLLIELDALACRYEEALFWTIQQGPRHASGGGLRHARQCRCLPL